MTARAPRVSVVLPARDEQDVIGAAVDSMLAQTEPNFELLVIDDGSRDRTAETVAGRAARDSRVRLLRQGPEGLVAALNRGLGEARAPYAARMDADDVSEPDRLRLQADLLDGRREIGLVGSLVAHEGDVQRTRGLALWTEWSNSLTSPQAISAHRFVESPLVHPSVMFRRELVDRFGGYRDGPFPEDYELWLRWLEHGVRMAKVEQALLRWRERPNRLTRTDPRYSTEAFFACKAPYLFRRLREINSRHPEVWIWGAGRATRLRVRVLISAGLRVGAFVDIDPKKIGGRVEGAPVLSPDQLPPPGGGFVLSCVGKRGARELIGRALTERGYRIERDWLPCA